jgi:hypothetical protein
MVVGSVMTDISPKENKQNIRFGALSRDDPIEFRISIALHELEVEANRLIDRRRARFPMA